MNAKTSSVGVGPVEIAVRVFDVAVEGDVRDVDQLGHAAKSSLTRDRECVRQSQRASCGFTEMPCCRWFEFSLGVRLVVKGFDPEAVAALERVSERAFRLSAGTGHRKNVRQARTDPSLIRIAPHGGLGLAGRGWAKQDGVSAVADTRRIGSVGGVACWPCEVGCQVVYTEDASSSGSRYRPFSSWRGPAPWSRPRPARACALVGGPARRLPRSTCRRWIWRPRRGSLR